ncbi:dethiobiotin synthase [Paenibacillus darwinianus]|uniref:ATP-dependent dethiobiotin synthetase BioD n=2 Tax=Paenibacillus darwinianus TaxID=1380763 RepID=A0A9W5S1T9_9BACL|nr:dethiobiotin synthase [Paenibacillus darwinianus]EXX90719.1 dethiobiotin synthase [Paenibacillus darwinianus]EXX90921.1 dethiobiotin synthase [Paenibacillus darwinianus]
MKRINGLFIAGTDTGVGKTIITAALTAALRADGVNAGIWKPVQSGAPLGSGITDAERLISASGIEELPQAVAPFTFDAPLTPMLAAKQAGVTLVLQKLLDGGEPLVQRYDALLVEGAGGVAVPLTDEHLVIDFIAHLGIPVLIVARSGLGTINHTILTASLLRQRSIPIIGVILNDGEQTAACNDPSRDTNAELIERFSGLKVLGRFPPLQGVFTPKALTEIIRKTVPILPIKQAMAFDDTGGTLE